MVHKRNYRDSFKIIFRAQKKRLAFSWGAGSMGQLGIGSEIVNKNLPTEIQAFQEEDLV